MELLLPYCYTPRHYQRNFWKTCIRGALTKGGIKRACWVVHRRGGKDKTMFNALIGVAMERMANYNYYFPTAELGRKALWNNIDVTNGMRVIDHVPKGLIDKINQTTMQINLVSGSTIRILGTDNLDVVGGNPFGIVFSESAQHNPMSWHLTRPILAENGGFAWFNGTPRGRNWFYDLKNMALASPQWFCEVLSVDVTGAVTAEQIEAERRSGMPEAMIRQEFYCDFNIGQVGSIYADLVEQQRNAERITNDVCYYPNHPVYAAFDLGLPANTKCWIFQIVQDRIKFLESLSGGLECQTQTDWARRLLNERKYRYDAIFLPHDGATMWQRLMTDAGFTNVRVLDRPYDEWDNINAAKSSFARCDFNARTCHDGLEALEHWHCETSADERTIREKPLHDWSSHYCTAFGYAHQAIKSRYVSDKWGSIPETPDRFMRSRASPAADPWAF